MNLRALVIKAGDVQRLQPPDRLDLGRLNLGTVGPTLTVTANAVTVSASIHPVFSNSSTASVRRIQNINGGVAGDILIIKGAASSLTVVLRDNEGNLKLAGDFSIDALYDTIVLVYDGSFWIELCRSNNGA